MNVLQAQEHMSAYASALNTHIYIWTFHFISFEPEFFCTFYDQLSSSFWLFSSSLLQLEVAYTHTYGHTRHIYTHKIAVNTRVDSNNKSMI